MSPEAACGSLLLLYFAPPSHPTTMPVDHGRVGAAVDAVADVG